MTLFDDKWTRESKAGWYLIVLWLKALFLLKQEVTRWQKTTTLLRFLHVRIWGKLRGLMWVKIRKFLNLVICEYFKPCSNNWGNLRHNRWNTSVFAQCPTLTSAQYSWKWNTLTQFLNACCNFPTFKIGKRLVDEYLVAVVIITSTAICDGYYRVKVEHFSLKLPFT